MVHFCKDHSKLKSKSYCDTSQAVVQETGLNSASVNRQVTLHNWPLKPKKMFLNLSLVVKLNVEYTHNQDLCRVNRGKVKRTGERFVNEMKIFVNIQEVCICCTCSWLVWKRAFSSFCFCDLWEYGGLTGRRCGNLWNAWSIKSRHQCGLREHPYLLLNTKKLQVVCCVAERHCLKTSGNAYKLLCCVHVLLG